MLDLRIGLLAVALSFAACAGRAGTATRSSPSPPIADAANEPKSSAPGKKAKRSKADRAARRVAAGLEHRRSAYDTATWDAPPPEVRAIVDVIAAAARNGRESGSTPDVVLDAGLSRVAAKLATDPTASTAVDSLLYQRTHEAGSPLEPRWVLRVNAAEATLDWARSAVTAMQTIGKGTLAIGVGLDPRRPEERVVVWTRKAFDLVGKVPRRDAREVRLVLDPGARARTPRLLVVSASGVDHIEGTRSGDTWSFSSPRGFDGTLTALVGYDKPPDRFTDPLLRVGRGALGGIQFAPPTVLPGDEEKTLEASIGALRRAWGRAPYQIDSAFVPSCAEPVRSIGGVRILQGGHCVSWRSSGSDAERWAALRFYPALYELFEDDYYDFVQIRRDPETTTLRLGRSFRELTVEQARAHLTAELARRFPAAKHDAALDRLPAGMAKRWAAKGQPRATVAAFTGEADSEAAKWVKSGAAASWVIATEDLDSVFRGLDPPEGLTRYAVGVARSGGPDDELPYFVVVYYAKGKP